MKDIIVYTVLILILLVGLFQVLSLFICTSRNIYVDEQGFYYELVGMDLYNNMWKWQKKRKLPLFNLFVDACDIPFWLDDEGFISYEEHKQAKEGINNGN